MRINMRIEMSSVVRTTLELPDPLFARLKARAALKQDQFGEALKVVIETDQSPLVRDRECRQMGICAQP